MYRLCLLYYYRKISFNCLNIAFCNNTNGFELFSNGILFWNPLGFPIFLFEFNIPKKAPKINKTYNKYYGIEEWVQ
jgi:hypothetical protein